MLYIQYVIRIWNHSLLQICENKGNYVGEILFSGPAFDREELQQFPVSLDTVFLKNTFKMTQCHNYRHIVAGRGFWNSRSDILEETLHPGGMFDFHASGKPLHFLSCLKREWETYVFCAGVTVHAAVCRVCDSQPGWLHALLSECTDGEIVPHLPGNLICLFFHFSHFLPWHLHLFVLLYVDHRWSMVCVCVVTQNSPALWWRMRL